jgi:LysM repeat protein
MNKSNLIPMFLNLQLFAEGTGGDGGTGAEGATGVSATAAVSQTKGVKSNPLANVKYGVQPEETPPAAKVEETAPIVEDRNAKFEELIKGEYKDLYDARVQDTVQKRLKGSKETVEKYEALTPTLELLAKKYGVDASDIKALNKAIEEDDSYYEEEALQKGMSVEQLKEFRKIERENAELRKAQEEQARQENANKLYGKWMNEAEATKKVYPSFDLRTEMQNPKFLDLIRSNIDVRTAFEVLHKDELIPAAMQYTAQQVAQKQANNIIANGARPTENGISSQGATLTKSDVSQLTKEDRAEINRRVARGEKITFSR